MHRSMWLFVAVWFVCLTVAFPGMGLGAVIVGRVIDADTGAPLPAETFPYTWLNLSRYNEDFQYFEFVAYTNCFPSEGEPKEGCVDGDGNFQFSKKFDGSPLEAGSYFLQAYASEYLSGFVQFDFDGATDMDIGVLALDPSPVTLEFQCCPSPVPSEGGELKWEYTVTNLTGQILSLGAYAIVNSLTEMGFYTNFQVGQTGKPNPVKLILLPNTFKEVEQTVEIPGEIPDGFYIYVYIYVTEPNDPFRVLAQSGFVVSKGSSSASRVLTPAELLRMPGAIR